MIGIAIGGFFGAVTRYLVYLKIEKAGRHKKWATFLVNSTGSFLIGLSIGSNAFWLTGFLGAFTTFSTFALEAVEGIIKGESYATLFYLLVTLFIGLGLFSLGFILGR